MLATLATCCKRLFMSWETGSNCNWRSRTTAGRRNWPYSRCKRALSGWIDNFGLFFEIFEQILLDALIAQLACSRGSWCGRHT